MSSNAPRLETRLRSFFGLKSMPFAKDLDPDRLFETETLREAMAKLDYLVDRRGIGTIFGAPGTGKSTLLRSFMAGTGKATHSICYVSHTTCAVLDLFRDIARGFQIEPRYRKADVIRDIKERLVKLSRGQKVQPVLIIDDAHLLPTHVLDDLRLLTSFDADTNEEVDAYLSFRLELAGRTAALFLKDATEAVSRAGRGVPRIIDRLAEHSMLIAMRERRKEIDAEIVTQAIEEVDP